MEKIYEFKQFSEKYAAKKEKYTEELMASLNTLYDFCEKVHLHMINLAVRDKWAKWNADKPVGFGFVFTEEMLSNTGDENINDLFYICEEALSTLYALRIRNKIALKEENGEVVFKKENGEDENAE